MSWTQIVVLFIEAVMLVARWMRDQQAAGKGREQALKEITDVLNARIDAAALARRQPDDPGPGVQSDHTIYRD